MAALDGAAAAVYDVIVIGRGPVGSAAAKYAAAGGKRVALVGPDEASMAAHRTYGCHADEGRICRRLDTDPVWAALAARAMDRYASIEAASGVAFHDASGCLAVGRADGAYLGAVAATAAARGLVLERLDAAALRARWPALRLDAGLLRDGDEDDPPAYAGLHEPAATGAGRVSPRRLVAAQAALFERAGGRSYDGVAVAVAAGRDGGAPATVTLGDGGVLRGDAVLVCTNAFTNFQPLLPRRVALTLTTQTVKRRAYADAPADMPSIIVRSGDGRGGAAPESLDGVYALPPVDYGDGCPAIKVGHGSFFERPLLDAAAARAWYEDRTAEERTDSFARCELAAVCGRLLRPRAPPLTDATDRCVIPKTATNRPYVHKFSPRLGCCVGCNGYAAKSSDELGRLAARMMDAAWIDGDWDGDDIPRDAFTAVFAD